MARVDGLSLGMIGAGSLFLYAAATGRSIPAELQAFVQGKPPSSVAAGASPFGAPNAGSGPAAAAAANPGTSGPVGQEIVADAVKYIGKLGWTFGGTMNSGSPDCSGFVNGVLGRDLHLAIPGYPAGTFDGSVHGPASFGYPLWSGVEHISRAAVSPGDLCVWENAIGHIGIAVDNKTLVSDLNPSLGVQETPIDSTDSGVLVCLRLKAAIGTSGSAGPGRIIG